MQLFELLHRSIAPQCADCPYRLGEVRCVVSPCPACRATGRRPPFDRIAHPGRRDERRRWEL